VRARARFVKRMKSRILEGMVLRQPHVGFECLG
jgi:hypothetical protein